MEWLRYEFRVSTDPRLLQLAVIHNFLRQTYWANEINESVLRKALDGSLCFGLYRGEQQIGLARVITDRATFAYLSDVFVLDDKCPGIELVVSSRNAKAISCWQKFGFEITEEQEDDYVACFLSLDDTSTSGHQ